MIIYLNGRFLNHEEAKISPFDRGFLFSDSVYEAIRTYNKKLFCIDEHIKRLRYSLDQLLIPFNKFSDLKAIIYKTAELNNIKNDFSVYLQITRGVGFPRTHYYGKIIEPTIFLYVSPIKDHSKELDQGVQVILEKDISWTRCDIKSTSLLPATIANQKAFLNKKYEAILYRDDYITEGSHTNFFAVKDGMVFTAPLSNYILEGVTRGVVLNICDKNNIDVNEEYINMKELNNFDEFFITGTSTEITPVVKIDDLIINNGVPGNITRQVQKLFLETTCQTN
jgi:D-alanine transaminase